MKEKITVDDKRFEINILYLRITVRSMIVYFNH